MKDQWPADANQAYEMVAHHVFMALYDVDSSQTGAPGAGARIRGSSSGSSSGTGSSSGGFGTSGNSAGSSTTGNSAGTSGSGNRPGTSTGTGR